MPYDFSNQLGSSTTVGYTAPNYSGYSSTGTTSGTTSTSFLSSSIGQSLIGGGINTFFNIVGGLFASKQEKDRLNQQSRLIAQSTEGQLAVEQERTKQAELMANSQKGGASGNSVLYIGLGIGALVMFGLVIFAVTRKK